jgi:hypothetical protein
VIARLAVLHKFPDCAELALAVESGFPENHGAWAAAKEVALPERV